MKKNDFFEIKPEIQQALAANQPVIALESTIIAHGMPYPQNLETAMKLENIARKKNVLPATICLMDGKIKIGLDDSELEKLAKAKSVRKVSLRDIARVLMKKQIGATTVAATMFAAEKIGIKVFATGGIGGIHRNFQKNLDISTDLKAFSQFPIIVVSAGVKAILDLSNTLEMMETLGIPVFGYRTDVFPSFYSAGSKFQIESIDSAKEIGEVYHKNLELGISTGILVANPIPQKYEIPTTEMEIFIDKALQEADKYKISGKKLTPFLLAKIVELSDGRSLETNIKLAENNVLVACEIAISLRS